MKTRQEVIDYFKPLDYNGFESFYKSEIEYFNSFDPARINKTTYFPTQKGEILCIPIRCNEDIGFNDGTHFYNDVLVIMQIIDEDKNIKVYFINVTCDPYADKPHIAHLARQIYRGNVGLHKGQDGRWCIRSDAGTWYRRTENGKVVVLNNGHFDAEFGAIGVNIHNRKQPNGVVFLNSSLGCIIIWNEEGDYKLIFVPLIRNCTNENNIMVIVCDMEDISDYIVQAQAVNGITNDSAGAKP